MPTVTLCFINFWGHLMSVGSKWYKFDFHNHTPASNDYQDPALSVVVQ